MPDGAENGIMQEQRKQEQFAVNVNVNEQEQAAQPYVQPQQEQSQGQSLDRRLNEANQQSEFTVGDVEKELDDLETYLGEREEVSWAQKYDNFPKLFFKLRNDLDKLKTKSSTMTDSRWVQLRKSITDAAAQVREKDEKQKKLANEATEDGLESEIYGLLADTSFTDSGAYRRVCDAARDYLNAPWEEKAGLLRELRSKISEYTTKRYKKDGYSTDKGERRMARMDRLLALTGGLEKVVELPENAANICFMFRDNLKRNVEVEKDMREEFKGKLDFAPRGVQNEWHAPQRIFSLLKPYGINGKYDMMTRQENIELISNYFSDDQYKKIDALSKLFSQVWDARLTPDMLTKEYVEEHFEELYKKTYVMTLLDDMIAPVLNDYPDNPVLQLIVSESNKIKSAWTTCSGIMTQVMTYYNIDVNGMLGDDIGSEMKGGCEATIAELKSQGTQQIEERDRQDPGPGPIAMQMKQNYDRQVRLFKKTSENFKRRNNLTGDAERLDMIIPVWETREDGMPASNEDALKAAEAKVIVYGLLGEDKDLTYEAMRILFEEMSQVSITEDLINPLYIKEHMWECYKMQYKLTMIQNLKEMNPDVFEMLPDNYKALREAYNTPIWGIWTNMVANCMKLEGIRSGGASLANSVEEIQDELEELYSEEEDVQMTRASILEAYNQLLQYVRGVGVAQ